MRPKIKVAGHAVQGRGHATQNIVCQDKVDVVRFPDKCSALVALADGAGSSTHSHIGAEYAVSEIGKIIRDRFELYFEDPEKAGSDIVDRLQRGLRGLALAHSVPFKSLSSTLLFVYVRRSRKITRFFAGHIGDGVIAIRRRNKCEVLSYPENGAFANSTVFLTSVKAVEHFRVYSGTFKGNVGFLLLSDGTAESLYVKRNGAMAPACDTIQSWFDKYPQKKVAMAINRNLELVLKKMTLDDCSIAALGITGIECVRQAKN